jgi:hypothetical protein
MWGDAKDVAKEYEKFCWQEQGVVLHNAVPSDDNELPTTSILNGTNARSLPSVPPQVFEPNPGFERNRQRTRIGTGDVIIRNFLVFNDAGLQVNSCEYNQKLIFYYLAEVCRVVNSDFIIGIRLRDLKGNFVYSANDMDCIHRIEGAPGDRLVLSTDLRVPLAHQDYVILTGIFGFQDGNAFLDGIYDYSRSVIWDVIEDAGYLKVHPCRTMPLAGPVHAAINLRVQKLN